MRTNNVFRGITTDVHSFFFSFYRKIFFVSLLLIFLMIGGCTAPNYVWPPYDKITLYANPNVNPDDNNRPSPIRIKIYELAARTTFDNLDFQGLFINGSTLLSDELISEETFVIQPNETLSHKIGLSKAATHIAIVAAYRKIDEARWKHIYPVKSYGYYKHAIEFTNDAIEIKKSERSNKSEEPNEQKRARNPRKDRNEKSTTKTTLPNQDNQNSDFSEFKKTSDKKNAEHPIKTDVIEDDTEKNRHEKVHQT